MIYLIPCLIAVGAVVLAVRVEQKQPWTGPAPIRGRLMIGNVVLLEIKMDATIGGENSSCDLKLKGSEPKGKIASISIEARNTCYIIASDEVRLRRNDIEGVRVLKKEKRYKLFDEDELYINGQWLTFKV